MTRLGKSTPGLLIDDGGRVCPVEPDTVAHRFGALRCRRDFVTQAVSLGFIFVSFHETGTQIAFRPQFITRKAISRLAVLTAVQRPSRIALSRDGMMSSWELIVGANRALALIDAVVAEAQRPQPRPLLYVQPLPLERCRDVAQGRLFSVLQAWEQRRGRWDACLYERLEEAGLLPGTMVSRQPRGSERLLIDHWAANYTSFGKDWKRIARGRDVEDQPNADFGQWRAATIRKTIAAGVPELTACDHVLRGIDGRLVRLKFHRLALPWRTSDRAVLVSGINVCRRAFVLERPNPAN